MPAAPIRMLVVDDHTLLRTALCNILRTDARFEPVAEAADGEDAVRKAVLHRPDIVLLDVEMPGQPVATTVRQLGEVVPGPAVMILSMYDDHFLRQDLAGLGVMAFLHKSVTMETLTSAISLLAGAGRDLTISVSAHSRRTNLVPQNQRTPGSSRSSGPSAREVEILRCVAEAMSNRQIATSLGITEGTVKRHLRNIFDKLDAVSRLDAVNKAMARALIGPTTLQRPRLPLRRTPTDNHAPRRGSALPLR
jgi:two-component system nitrate/nitrite response regulator NarL